MNFIKTKNSIARLFFVMALPFDLTHLNGKVGTVYINGVAQAKACTVHLSTMSNNGEMQNTGGLYILSPAVGELGVGEKPLWFSKMVERTYLEENNSKIYSFLYEDKNSTKQELEAVSSRRGSIVERLPLNENSGDEQARYRLRETAIISSNSVTLKTHYQELSKFLKRVTFDFKYSVACIFE